MHTNVCDNNVYKAQACPLFYYIVLIAKCTGQWHCGSTAKDELPDPRGSLENDIPSRTIEQANQKFDKMAAIHNMACVKPSVRRLVISVY